MEKLRLRPSSSKTKVLALVGAFLLGSGAGYYSRDASEAPEGVKPEVKQKDSYIELGRVRDELKKIRKKLEEKTKWLNITSKQLEETASSEVTPTEDEILNECREIEAERGRVAALEVIEALGISKEENASKIKEAYALGCVLGTVDWDDDWIKPENKFACEPFEIVGESLISPESFKSASDAERRVWEDLRSEKHEAALESFGVLLPEIDSVLNDMSRGGFLYSDEAKKMLYDSYRSFERDRGPRGYCEYYEIVNDFYRREDKADVYDKNLSDAARKDLHAKWIRVRIQLNVLMKIVDTIAERDYPELASTMWSECKEKYGFQP